MTKWTDLPFIIDLFGTNSSSSEELKSLVASRFGIARHSYKYEGKNVVSIPSLDDLCCLIFTKSCIRSLLRSDGAMELG